MSEEIGRKKKVRSAHRAVVTRFLQKTKELLEESEPDLAQLEQRKMTFFEKSEILKQIDKELLEVVADEELESEIEQSDTIQEKIRLAILELELKERREKRVKSPTPTRSPTPTGTKSHTSTRSSTPERGSISADPTAPHLSTQNINSSKIPTTQVKLPKLTLKRFNGDLTMWTSFWESFESTIHKNPSLSNIDKFNYLNSLLERSAADAIVGLSLTSSNYLEAIDILRRRFGNKQLIVNRHMEELLQLNSVASSTNLKGLRRLYDTVESHVRGLKSLGIGAESYGSLLSSVLMNKLPTEFRQPYCHRR